MNRLIIGTILVLSFFSATSQTEKGGWLIGASSDLGFSSKDVGADHRFNVFSLNTSAGYFVIDNLSLGLNLGFSFSSIEDSNTNRIEIGPALRYYFNKIFVGTNYSKARTKANGMSASTNQLGFIAGYAIFINDKIAIEPNLNYSTWFGGDLDESTDSFGVQVGFNLYF